MHDVCIMHTFPCLSWPLQSLNIFDAVATHRFKSTIETIVFLQRVLATFRPPNLAFLSKRTIISLRYSLPLLAASPLPTLPGSGAGYPEVAPSPRVHQLWAPILHLRTTIYIQSIYISYKTKSLTTTGDNLTTNLATTSATATLC